MKECVWTVAQYGLNLIEYWFGLKILFGAKIHRKWIGGVGALLLILPIKICRLDKDFSYKSLTKFQTKSERISLPLS